MTAIHYHGHIAKRGPEVAAWVEVYTCSGKYADIYSDEKLTIPMSNPLVADRDGDYQFFSAETRGKTVIHVVGSKPRTMNTCRMPGDPDPVKEKP